MTTPRQGAEVHDKLFVGRRGQSAFSPQATHWPCDRCGDSLPTERSEIHDGWVCRHCPGCKRAMSPEQSGYRVGARWVLVALALLTGCTGYAPADGVTAAPELLETCLVAAERWGEATGLLPSCESGRPMVAGNVRGVPAGHTDGARVTVEMTDPACLELFVAHELGHVLAGGGDGEHPRGGSLMAAQPPSCGALITSADVSFVCGGAPCAWEQTEE